jgi:hypothetical protein
MTAFLSPEGVQPRKDLVLVKRYDKPEKVGHLFLPDSAREDQSGLLWEFVKAGKEVSKEVGMEIPFGSIIKTRPGKAVDSGLVDPEDNKVMFFLHWEDLNQILPNTWDQPKE